MEKNLIAQTAGDEDRQFGIILNFAKSFSFYLVLNCS